MKLADLEPQLIAWKPKGKRVVISLDEAQGLYFLCPKGCGHLVVVWFSDRGVPESEAPGPGRWTPLGTGLSDLTLTPSINLSGPGCGWHGFVVDGEVRDA